MTDNEIVKALECCTAKPRALCKECPYFLGNGKCKLAELQRDALDLINRQQAKIEQLQELCGNADGYADALEEYTREKSIKEFAERLVSKAKSTKERFLLKSLVESVMKETGCRDESKT